MKNLYNVFKLGFLIVFLGVGHLSIAQERTVSGKVVDVAEGAAIPGVNIMVKGKTTGAVTNVDGEYQVQVLPEDVLVFSFVGYLTEEVAVGNQSIINVRLASNIHQLQEIVVIGYGEVRREDATGSVTAIRADEINRGAPITPEEIMQGRMAGVQITTAGGQPGSSAQIRIRGGSSLSASNNPLIVIDGVPVDTEGISGMGNPLSSIHPNDIETFTVLKDASATAIYGSRASNGVIIITTKKGLTGKPISVNYNGFMTFNSIDKKIDVLPVDEFREFIAENHPNAVPLLGNANTDWQEEIFRNSIGQDHHLSVTGAFNNLPYRASVGFTDQDGILKTSNFKRFTGSIGINPKFLNNTLSVDLNIKGVYNKNRFADQGAIGAAIQFDPTQPIYNESGDYGGWYTWMSGENPSTVAIPNPMSQLYDKSDRSTVKRSIGNLHLEYQLPFLPELKANYNIGYDYSSSEGMVIVAENSNFSWTALDRSGGSFRPYSQSKENVVMDFYLNYNKEIPAILSKIDVTAGYAEQHFGRKEFNFESTANRETILRDTVNYKTENNLRSIFGRLNYTFLDRYLLTFTLRQDGTSRFHKDSRWGTFPSAAVAWQIAKEPWMNDSKLFSDLKLRIGYGITGQQNINQGDYPYLARYTYGENNVRYLFGNTWYNTLRAEGYNQNLKWEETTTYNAGLDYGFFDDRLTGSIDVYYRKTTDLLNLIPVAAGTNFTNELLTNIGDLENRGVEFSIFGRPIETGNVSWEVGFNATYNKNEITKLTVTDNEDYQGVFVGEVSGGTGNTIQIHSLNHPAYTFFVYEQAYNEDGRPIEGLYVDRNGDGQITGDDRYHYKKPSSDVFMGFHSKLIINDLDFSFSGRANIGNYVYNNVSSSAGFISNAFVNGFILNMVEDINHTQFRNAQYLSDYYIRNGSFARIDNITLGYTFKEILGNPLNARFYATVQNAFLFTNYKGLDPEVTEGRDNNVYPRPRVFLVGVNLNLF